MRATIALALAALIAAGCTTEPVRDSETVAVPMARVLAPKYLTSAPGELAIAVKRDPGFMSGGCRMQFRVDERPIAELKQKERLEIYLPAGDYVFSVKPICPLGGRGLSEAAAHIALGAPDSYRIGVTDSGNAFIVPTKF